MGQHARRLGAYDADAIRRLKDERDGVIYVSGSGRLVRGLLADGLVDELHLFVYPIALGEGERLWADGERPTKLALVAHDVYDNGVVHLAYGPADRLSGSALVLEHHRCCRWLPSRRSRSRGRSRSRAEPVRSAAASHSTSRH